MGRQRHGRIPLARGWRIVDVQVSPLRQGGRCSLQQGLADPGRLQLSGRLTQASPCNARCRPYSNSGRM
jgi:hypothetical protein